MEFAIPVFLIFLVLGMPVAFSIGLSGLTFFLVRDLPMSVLVQKSISTSQSFTMLAIPLFIFAGNLMNSSGITSRLMKLASVLTGHMYGNIGQVSCVLSTLMGGVSGSAVADAAMQSRILGPEMTRLGYAKGWSAAVNGLSGLIVATIPPSMGLIIYGTVGEVSIGRLFMAGWLPGILMMVFLMIACTISARKFGYKPERKERASLKEILSTMTAGFWALMFPVMLIVLIRFGIVSPTESGAFAVAYALFVGVFVYKELDKETFITTVKDSVKDITVITIILAFSGTFGYGVVYDDITTKLATTLMGISDNPTILLALVVFFLLGCGMFMETTVIALILTPILLPVMKSVGVDPVVFGMIMMTCVTFGVMTPPVGTALYTTSDIMGCSVEETVKYGYPFYIAVLLVVVFMVFFQDAVLFLPNLVYGASAL
ncbi:TRAP transporter large permease [Fusobacterium perfoetens]|uniref:TRAP transporter large permease n=1 Tax=Fusobacterium perfoetens TaxID=852 RepID=UPI001F18F201|nr:TRAP transporter large permease [Fusobacterium perfoetens]MCF2611893.1 TRAP transporter large permease [Fusobacterium perfoetens]